VAAKKLDGGRFRWPESNTTATKMVLSQEELALLVGGIDLVETRPRKWHRKSLLEASRESLKTA
jgi:transposase